MVCFSSTPAEAPRGPSLALRGEQLIGQQLRIRAQARARGPQWRLRCACSSRIPHRGWWWHRRGQRGAGAVRMVLVGTVFSGYNGGTGARGLDRRMLLWHGGAWIHMRVNPAPTISMSANRPPLEQKNYKHLNVLIFKISLGVFGAKMKIKRRNPAVFII